MLLARIQIVLYKHHRIIFARDRKRNFLFAKSAPHCVSCAAESRKEGNNKCL